MFKKADKEYICNHANRIGILLFAFAIFVGMAIFFIVCYPMLIFDTDDWLYIYQDRMPLPEIGGWNPTRILPEVLMPAVSMVGAKVFYPLTGDYLTGLTIAHGLMVAGMVTAYCVGFALLFMKKREQNIGEAVLCGTIFLLLHFLIFRSGTEANGHLLYGMNVTSYYYYVIPTLLNYCLVFLFMRRNVQEQFLMRGHFFSKLFLVGILYFALFSNLFSSVVLAAFWGGELIRSLYNDIRGKQFGFFRYVKQNYFYLSGILVWFVVNGLELTGGRAQDVDNKGLVWGLGKSFKSILSLLLHVGIGFWIVLLILLVGSAIVQFVEKKKMQTSWLLYMSLSFCYLLLLCAASKPEYMGREDVALAFLSFLLMGMLYMMVEIYRSIGMKKWMAMLFCLALIICIYTPGQTFKYINYCGYAPEVAREIEEDIIGQLVEADQSGVTEIVLRVPKYKPKDNWPIARYGKNRFGEALYKHGVLQNPVRVSKLKRYKLKW